MRVSPVALGILPTATLATSVWVALTSDFRFGESHQSHFAPSSHPHCPRIRVGSGGALRSSVGEGVFRQYFSATLSCSAEKSRAYFPVCPLVALRLAPVLRKTRASRARPCRALSSPPCGACMLSLRFGRSAGVEGHCDAFAGRLPDKLTENSPTPPRLASMRNLAPRFPECRLGCKLTPLEVATPAPSF